jgi:hypothetical protein
MAATYNLNTAIGQLRLLAIKDTNIADPVFTDEEYEVFLGIEGDNMLRSIARVLETVATSSLYVQKVIRLLDIQTDGAALAREFRMQAERHRKQADEEESRAGTNWAIAEQNVSDFSEREIWRNEWLRDGI